MTGELRPLTTLKDPVVRQHLRRVLSSYGHLSPGLLVAISHAPRGPWATVRDRAARATALGARIPDSLTLERFHFHKIVVRDGVHSAELADDEPLSEGKAVSRA